MLLRSVVTKQPLFPPPHYCIDYAFILREMIPDILYPCRLASSIETRFSHSMHKIMSVAYLTNVGTSVHLYDGQQHGIIL